MTRNCLIIPRGGPFRMTKIFNASGHLCRMDLKKMFQDISTHFRQLYKLALMCRVGELHVSAVLLAAIQLECSPIIFDASDKWVSSTLINLLKEKR